jgi:hypothetical protein
VSEGKRAVLKTAWTVVHSRSRKVVPAEAAEAIRWALTRIRERPAYEQLREHTRDIERLKSEF